MKAICLHIFFLLSVVTTGKVFAQQQPNFIFFIMDDVGWNDLGCYGGTNVKTPHIDRLAATGMKFTNAYLSTSSCSPSRNSIITGRYPHNTGAPELHDPLPRGMDMFPQRLKDAGYYTALSGKNHMGQAVRAAFDTISSGKGPGGQEDWIALLRNRPKDQPFFFWLASNDAHRDWQFNEHGQKIDPAGIKVPPMLFDGPETRKDLAGYFYEISRIDHFTGLLMKELENQHLLHNTYFILMSDNGRPFPRNKARLYDSGIKTPFIVSGPGVNGIQNALISAIDIAPTILEIAGVSPSEKIQGKSFYSLLANKKKKTRDFVFAEHNWHVFQAYERMVRFGDWMYIFNGYPERKNLSAESASYYPAGKELWQAYKKGLTVPEQQDVFLQPRPSEELYYLPNDPNQFHNVAASPKNKKILAYLRKALEDWVQQTGDSKPENPTPDRMDENGNELKGWEKRERPGEKFNAKMINHPGPIMKKDIKAAR